MADDNSVKVGLRVSTITKITSIREVATFDPTDVIGPAKLKISDPCGSKLLFTKKYNPRRIKLLRMMFSVAANEDMELRSVDVKTAFLHLMTSTFSCGAQINY